MGAARFFKVSARCPSYPWVYSGACSHRGLFAQVGQVVLAQCPPAVCRVCNPFPSQPFVPQSTLSCSRSARQVPLAQAAPPMGRSFSCSSFCNPCFRRGFCKPILFAVRVANPFSRCRPGIAFSPRHLAIPSRPAVSNVRSPFPLHTVVSRSILSQSFCPFFVLFTPSCLFCGAITCLSPSRSKCAVPFRTVGFASSCRPVVPMSKSHLYQAFLRFLVSQCRFASFVSPGRSDRQVLLAQSFSLRQVHSRPMDPRYSSSSSQNQTSSGSVPFVLSQSLALEGHTFSA